MGNVCNSFIMNMLQKRQRGLGWPKKTRGINIYAHNLLQGNELREHVSRL